MGLNDRLSNNRFLENPIQENEVQPLLKNIHHYTAGMISTQESSVDAEAVTKAILNLSRDMQLTFTYVPNRSVSQDSDFADYFPAKSDLVLLSMPLFMLEVEKTPVEIDKFIPSQELRDSLQIWLESKGIEGWYLCLNSISEGNFYISLDMEIEENVTLRRLLQELIKVGASGREISNFVLENYSQYRNS
jgi:hypothetical protein